MFDLNFSKIKNFTGMITNINNYKKLKNIKLRDYFKIIHPQYTYLQIIPDTSIRNYNSSTIAKTIQTLYKTLWGRINFDTKPWTLEPAFKVSFYMYIEKNDVEFYFIVPAQYEDLMREKISEVWGRATITTVNVLPMFSEESLKYELVYSKEDALSLSLDKKCNEPLNSIFNVLDIMQDGDKIGLFYNFIPASQRAWRKQYNQTMDCIKHYRPIDKEKFNIKYIGKVIFLTIIDVLNIAIETVFDFLGSKKKQKDSFPEMATTSIMLEDRKKPSRATINKRDTTIIDTQILLLSDSENKSVRQNNALAVAGAFHTIAEDNELTYRRIKGKFELTKIRLNKVRTNKMSVEECQSLLELPGRDLLKRYTSIKKVDVLQNTVPKELKKGYMSLGTVTVKDTTVEAFLPQDHIYGNLPVTLCGGEGEGKTTYIIRKAYESWKRNEAFVAVDFIKKCDLSRKIMEKIPSEDIIKIDCSDNINLPGLGYNEIKPKSDNPYDILDAASMQTEQFQALIDACNDEPLSDQMLKYFLAASNIVTLHQGMNLKNINECLDNHVKRHGYIEYAEDNEIFKEELSEEIQILKELDEKDKQGNVIGTKYTSIKFIQNRITKLKSNRRLKLMYGKSCSNNIDLVKAIKEKKVILIMLPQIYFGNPLSKNIAATFFVSKLWSVAQIIGDETDEPDRVNIAIDELYQVPMAEKIIGDNLDQARKFGHRYIFSCHSFNQLSIAPQLKNEGSYVFFHNIDYGDYKAFKELLDPYEYEDIKSMKQWHVLNLIKYKGGYGKFASKLPPPIK